MIICRTIIKYFKLIHLILSSHIYSYHEYQINGPFISNFHFPRNQLSTMNFTNCPTLPLYTFLKVNQ